MWHHKVCITFRLEVAKGWNVAKFIIGKDYILEGYASIDCSNVTRTTFNPRLSHNLTASCFRQADSDSGMRLDKVCLTPSFNAYGQANYAAVTYVQITRGIR
jgi:hypothetical protein